VHNKVQLMVPKIKLCNLDVIVTS
ncbi:hypothetical protein JTE90_008122, partial [Oedothorax gibbosus]